MIYFVPWPSWKSENLILFYLMDNNVIFFKCIISGEPFLETKSIIRSIIGNRNFKVFFYTPGDFQLRYLFISDLWR